MRAAAVVVAIAWLAGCAGPADNKPGQFVGTWKSSRPATPLHPFDRLD